LVFQKWQIFDNKKYCQWKTGIFGNICQIWHYLATLPTHYDCCPTFNAIYRLCVQQEQHITGACDIVEEQYGILFTTQTKRSGHKAS